MDFQCGEGTGEDQERREGCRVKAVPTGERQTEVMSAGSQRAWSLPPTEREVTEGKAKENENNSFSVPTTETPQIRNMCYSPRRLVCFSLLGEPNCS